MAKKNYGEVVESKLTIIFNNEMKKGDIREWTMVRSVKKSDVLVVRVDKDIYLLEVAKDGTVTIQLAGTKSKIFVTAITHESFETLALEIRKILWMSPYAFVEKAHYMNAQYKKAIGSLSKKKRKSMVKKMLAFDEKMSRIIGKSIKLIHAF